MVLVAQGLVLVDQCLPHPRRVLFVHAEHDGLLEPVAALLEKLSDLLGHQLGAVIDHQCPVEVLGIVNAVFDFVAIAVDLTFFRPVPLDVPVNMDLDHLIGRKKAVADSLPQGIGEDGLAEVMRVRNVFSFLRGSSQTDLGGRREMLQNFAPCGVVSGTSPMTLVDDDQVEKSRRDSRNSFWRSSGPVMA